MSCEFCQYEPQNGHGLTCPKRERDIVTREAYKEAYEQGYEAGRAAERNKVLDLMEEAFKTEYCTRNECVDLQEILTNLRSK